MGWHGPQGDCGTGCCGDLCEEEILCDRYFVGTESNWTVLSGSMEFFFPGTIYFPSPGMAISEIESPDEFRSFFIDTPQYANCGIVFDYLDQDNYHYTVFENGGHSVYRMAAGTSSFVAHVPWNGRVAFNMRLGEFYIHLQYLIEYHIPLSLHGGRRIGWRAGQESLFSADLATPGESPQFMCTFPNTRPVVSPPFAGTAFIDFGSPGLENDISSVCGSLDGIFALSMPVSSDYSYHEIGLYDCCDGQQTSWNIELVCCSRDGMRYWAVRVKEGAGTDYDHYGRCCRYNAIYESAPVSISEFEDENNYPMSMSLLGSYKGCACKGDFPPTITLGI